MMIVYDLWYEREYADREDTELHIGIYATEADAVAAIKSIEDQLGFCDYPEGFNIYPVTLGHTGWLEGFVTVTMESKEKDVIDSPPQPPACG